MGRGVKLIYYMQKFIIGRDIRHRFAIVCKADITFGVYYAIQGHASQLEKIDFLPVRARNRMVGIWKPGKRDAFILPVLPKDRQGVWADRQDFRPTAGELLMSISQTRQLRAAMRSHKTAQEREKYRSPAKIG